MSPVGRRRRTGGRKQGMPAVWVAAIVILIPVLITFYAFHRQIPFTSAYTDYAIVNNSVNVRGGSPVRIAGIDVGKVTSVSADANGTKLAFTVSDNGLPIHNDATLTIRDRLFLEGGYYLLLNPGSPSAPVAPAGWTIPLSSTSTPVQFYQLLSTFDLAARDSLKHLLNTLNQGFSAQPGQPFPASGAGGLKQAIPQLTPTLRDVAWVTRALRGTQYGDMERLLSSTSDVTTTLNKSGSQLTDLITSLNRTSGALAASDGALAQSITGLDQTLQVAPGALTAIDHSLPPLADLAVNLTPTLKVSPPLLSALAGDVRQVTRFVAPSARARLISSLDATLVEFPDVLTKLAGLFPVIKPATDCVTTHLTPVLEQQAQDVVGLSTGNPVWKDFVHGLTGLAGASGNFDANGPNLRALAGSGAGTLLNLGNSTLGSILGATTGSGSSVTGVNPQWVGDLSDSVFRPDVACSTQPVPSLSSRAAAVDSQTGSGQPALDTGASAVRAALRQAGRGGAR